MLKKLLAVLILSTFSLSAKLLQVEPDSQLSFSALTTGSAVLSWSSDLGSITQAGVWTAPSSPGTAVITADYGVAQDNITVLVAQVAPPHRS